jgi:parallel beta-helix repeat protein
MLFTRPWSLGVGQRAITIFAAFALFVMSGVVMSVPASAADTIHCGSVITTNTTLHADVGPCLTDGLIINASNITLDLGGHSVIGTFTAQSPNPPTNIVDGVGIHLNKVSGVTVRNGSVYHFAVGVRLDGSSGNTVSHLNVHDNIGILPSDAADNGDGIALYASNHNVIDHNIVRHDGPWDGIATLSSDGSSGTDGASYNTITNNLIVDNSVAMLDNNGLPTWKQDNGVAITGPGSTHNVVDHNVIDGSSVNGVQVGPACINSYGAAAQGCSGTVPNYYNVITNNIVRHNGFGAPIATAPVGDGILILSMGPRGIFEPGHETVDNNVVQDNERNGISIGGGNGEDLYNAPGTTNGENYGCSNLNSGGGNTGVPTADLCGSLYNTVSNNMSSGNGEDGIWIGPKSKFNMVDNNNVFGNRVDGIAVGLAVQYDTNSQAVPDGHGGFKTIAGTAGTENTIVSNIATGNRRWDGRDDNPGCDNTWEGNQFGTVNQPCVRGFFDAALAASPGP